MGDNVALETGVVLTDEDMADDALDKTLLEALEMKGRLAYVADGMILPEFAVKVLGMSPVRWWRWRSRGEAPVKVDEYLRIVAQFPELRGKVWRHLLWRAMRGATVPSEANGYPDKGMDGGELSGLSSDSTGAAGNIGG